MAVDAFKEMFIVSGTIAHRVDTCNALVERCSGRTFGPYTIKDRNPDVPLVVPVAHVGPEAEGEVGDDPIGRNGISEGTSQSVDRIAVDAVRIGHIAPFIGPEDRSPDRRIVVEKPVLVTQPEPAHGIVVGVPKGNLEEGYVPEDGLCKTGIPQIELKCLRIIAPCDREVSRESGLG